MGFRDLRTYLASLQRAGLLQRVECAINKNTELMPLVRWQYLGLAEQHRKAFLFTNVVDGTGRGYESPVVVSALGASRHVFAHALGCRVDQVRDTWLERTRQRIPPRLISRAEAEVKEVILAGEDLAGPDGGLARFPFPISTPGFDPAPYSTAGHWITKDLETGIRNVGNYRAMVKAPNRLGIQVIPTQHVAMHFRKARLAGQPLAAAVVIGAPPAVGMVAPAKFGYGVDELEVAGSLLGEPIELVKCETVDLEVPAHAEMVLEGYIRTDVWEPEGPFGEFNGYLGERRYHPFFEITCITHRRQPIIQVFLSQMPPSESSLIKAVANEAVYYDVLHNHCNLPNVLDVSFNEEGSAQHLVVIQMRKENPAQPWQALQAATALEPTYAKICIAVDEDIDPRDMFAVMWALYSRSQPARDWRIITGRASMLDPSAAPPESPPEQLWFPKPDGASGIMIDATRKWEYAPVSLPRREFMEKARELWQELGLPPLQPRSPWYGYPLGKWPEEWMADAEAALQGRHWETGEKLARGRKPYDGVA